jgi:GDP-mannose 6-dehydrogenase
MRISVFGLGYVGTVTAACLAANGHQVVGVDVAADKVESINGGRSPIVERDVDRIVGEAVAAGNLRAATDAGQAIADSELAIVCVGTPSSDNSGFDAQYVERVTGEIGSALASAYKEDFLFTLRSTVVPGTTQKLIVPILERSSGRTIGQGYDVAFYPEFLREGSSVEDFYHPPKIVVGERVAGSSRLLQSIYESIEAPRFITTLEAAEMIKYADNAFHAVKITFANEIGHVCKSLGIDSREVMEMFCSDRQLNISTAYFRPGFAFGGSCLPKDVRALLYEARHKDLHLPLLEGLLPSNQEQVERVLRLIERYSPELIGLVGLSFKPGTDDLRESPLVTVAERLLGRGYKLRIHDPNVETARLVGGNRAYVERHLPHLSRVMVPSLDDFSKCDVVVIGHPLQEAERLDAWLEEGKRVLDLIGKQTRSGHPGYSGLYW